EGLGVVRCVQLRGPGQLRTARVFFVVVRHQLRPVLPATGGTDIVPVDWLLLLVCENVDHEQAHAHAPFDAHVGHTIPSTEAKSSAGSMLDRRKLPPSWPGAT